MSAFYGGRAEARIVRTELPIVLLDFTSMYPSVNALLGTWPLLCSNRLRTRDVTRRTRLLADRTCLERCLGPKLWRDVGVTLVELETDGDLLNAWRLRPASVDYAMAINPLTYEGRLWYMLPNILAATVLSPLHGQAKSPRVVRALRLEPEGMQRGSSRCGCAAVSSESEARTRSLHDREERQRVRADESLSKEERERLQLFLKITANATAYGVLARFDRRERGGDTPVTIYRTRP